MHVGFILLLRHRSGTRLEAARQQGRTGETGALVGGGVAGVVGGGCLQNLKGLVKPSETTPKSAVLNEGRIGPESHEKLSQTALGGPTLCAVRSAFPACPWPAKAPHGLCEELKHKEARESRSRLSEGSGSRERFEC